MFAAGFCERAVGGRDEILGWPGEEGGVCWAGCCGIVLGGDVEGEGEEGEGVRGEVG